MEHYTYNNGMRQDSVRDHSYLGGARSVATLAPEGVDAVKLALLVSQEAGEADGFTSQFFYQ